MKQEAAMEREWGAECAVLNCTNRQGEGAFAGPICSPCWQFITTGEGRHSQAYRNAIETAVQKLRRKLQLL